MRSRAKKGLACLLAVLQLLVLLPLTAQAANDAPVLNPVIEGTVRFGSFNFNGDIPKGRDGIDYVSTFYYTDDRFSPSAVNPNAAGKVMEWTALEDLSMATLSKQFAVAVYGSSEGNVPVDWSHKSKNGERFLSDCGFSDIFVNDEFNTPTGKDTLGYLIGSKEITVWDQRTQQNRAFTLVAIGVRGGGYGGEWASNLTIGDREFAAGHDKSFSGTYRHKGFDDGAQRVLRDLDAYLAGHGIRGDVKYWISGYSRSGAIANLVAGEITKNAAQYQTSIDDVYGYTYESAAGALLNEDPDGTRYPNIHNILNPMDVVPLFAPRLFQNGRLGVDYRLPYYANTGEQLAAYYNRMRAVLPAVADIAAVYDRAVTGDEDDRTEDPVITDSDPETYPFDRPIQLKSFGLTNFSTGFTRDVSNAASHIAPDSGLYMDQFLAQFVDAFLNSRAWDAPFLRRTVAGWNADAMHRDDWQSHQKNYVSAYQEAIRTIAGYAFKTPGKGLRNLGGLGGNLMSIVDFETIFNLAGILSAYTVMDQSGGGLGYETAVGNMIEPMTTVLVKVVDQLGLFDEEDLPEVHEAIRQLTPALTWLYCEDHANADSEYFGTLVANMSNILVAHTPEMVESWLMSLDDVFISDYREITLPKATEADLFVFREGLDDPLSVDGRGALAATAENGVLVACRDDRITVNTSGETMTIRYPGNLDFRIDVRTLAGGSFTDLPVRLQELSPANVVNVRSVCTRDERGHITDDAVEHDAMLTPYQTASAQEINALSDRTAVALTDRDTLHILARHGSNQIADAHEGVYELSVTEDAPERRNPFEDVAEGRFYYDAVLWAFENGVTKGLTDTRFAPEQAMTRGQMVTFLWRNAGSPAPKAQDCPFTDLAPGSYYENAVRWAFENGVTKGVTDTRFAPDETVTRGQMVTFLWRIADQPKPETADCPFTDLTPGSFYETAVRWAHEKNVTNGVTESLFAPDESVTRGQAVTFLYRYAKG